MKPVTGFRFTNTLRQQLCDNLGLYQQSSSGLRHNTADSQSDSAASIDPESLKYAAVAIIVVRQQTNPALYNMHYRQEWADDAAVIMTLRASHMNKHANQWAFPGGRIEANETAIEASQRETQEEINLYLSDTDLLGELDDYVTRSGYHIKPYVYWLEDTQTLQKNPDEVAGVYRIPFHESVRADMPSLVPGQSPKHPIIYMGLGDYRITAPTAAILYQFRQVALLGEPTSVRHFDQAKFAWQ